MQKNSTKKSPNTPIITNVFVVCNTISEHKLRSMSISTQRPVSKKVILRKHKIQCCNGFEQKMKIDAATSKSKDTLNL
jgi:rRNA maturation endonuclease Nob1